MAELMDKGLKKSISAMGKDGVLIIGNTGAGKSTLVNYLLGYKMIETDRDGTDVYITEGSGGAVIGHSNSISETLFP
jgi:predicted GTPase